MPVQPRNDNKSEAATLCSIVSASFFQNSLEVDSALATFSVEANNGAQVRGIFDNASQSSFIAESQLKNFEHRILKDKINLTIKGINTHKTIPSRLVRITFGVEGRKCTLDAMVVPKIDINVKLPSLGPIIRAFKDRNYILADKFLTENSCGLANFELLLGADALHCFAGKTVKFGEFSAYIESDFGVMISGSIRKMIQDVASLKSFETSKNSELETHVNAICVGMFMCDDEVVRSKAPDNDQYKMQCQDFENSEYDKCSEKMLNDTCSYYLNEDSETFDNEKCELNSKLIKYLLENGKKSELSGRMCMPILWNSKVKHLLADNRRLAEKVLMSNFKKFGSYPGKFKMIDNNIRELENLKIIEKVDNMSEFIKDNPTFAYLPHNSIFKMNNETTKVRTVFMTNLAEKANNGLSLNQVTHAGPTINQKLLTSLILLRFDRKLLCFDVVKCFLQIEIPETDQAKLLFYWFKDVSKQDYTLQTWKNLRLTFGLKCSPCIWMCALYIMLIKNAKNDEEKLADLKRKIYGLTYMDNCAASYETSEELQWAYEQIEGIFEEYKCRLQKFNQRLIPICHPGSLIKLSQII